MPITPTSPETADAGEETPLADRLAAAMSALCGTAVQVRWSFRHYRLICTREDGTLLTRRAQEAFQQLLCAEIARTPAMGL